GTSGNRLFQYDLEGALASVTRGDGTSTIIGRDSAGRPTTLTNSRGTFVFAYDPTTTHLASVQTPEGETVQPQYDGALLLSLNYSGPVTGSVGFDYDASIRLKSETIDGSAIALSYDDDNLLKGVGQLAIVRDPASGDVVAETIGALTTTLSRSGFGEIDSR